MKLTDYIRSQRYPGRFIVLGQNGEHVLAIYGAMGRSETSRARRYSMDEHKDVWAERTDDVVEKEGNPDLLEYRALKWNDNGFVIANGRQIESGWESCDPEPDAYHTPRITLNVSYMIRFQAELFISRMTDGTVERRRWPLKQGEGKGYFISTYSGEDVRPTPSFSGDPIEVSMDFDSAKDAAKAVFDALAPQEGQEDYRVGVVGILMRGASDREVAIYNKL